MDNRAINRLATRFGLAAVVVVALPVALADRPDMLGPEALWWAAYAVFAATFLIDAWRPGETSPLALGLLTAMTPKVSLAVLVASGSTAFVVNPFDATGVLLIVSAIYAAASLEPNKTIVVLAGQLLVIGIGTWLGMRSVLDTVMSVATYGAFQAFAALMVYSAHREQEARKDLAAVHTELAAAHAELRASSAMLAESSRAAERLRIARDLHDLVGHQLTALSLELEVASHRAGGEVRAHVVKARDLAKSLLSDVRASVGNLRHDTPGLERPLRALLGELSQVEVELTIREDVDVDDQVALIVVRCVQEIVTNTLRHADAQRLCVDVAAEGTGVTVSAHDDGRGTDHVCPGNGLLGMRERVEDCGGRLAVRSGVGEGFAVTAWIPA